MQVSGIKDLYLVYKICENIPYIIFKNVIQIRCTYALLNTRKTLRKDNFNMKLGN